MEARLWCRCTRLRLSHWKRRIRRPSLGSFNPQSMETEMDSNSMKFASRRDLLSLGAAAGMASLFDQPHMIYASERHGKPMLSSESQNVRSFGAAGDAVTDDTAAVQKGMDAVHKSGGGTLYAPPGKYLFRGTLTVPPGVTLRGSYGCLPSHGSRHKT